VNKPPEQSSRPKSAPDDVVRRVQGVDPTATREAIDRFFAEMAEAIAAVHAIDSRDTVSPTSYTPYWGEGAKE
jgi:hypothetical protein